MRRLLFALPLMLTTLLVAGVAPASALNRPPFTDDIVATNSAAINGPTGGDTSPGGPASLFPSQVNVSGGTGPLSWFYVTVTLHDVHASDLSDLDVMLVSPSGQRLMMMSDVGGHHPLNGGDLTLDQLGSTVPTTDDAIPAGEYKPTNKTSSTCHAGYSDDAFEGFGDGTTPPVTSSDVSQLTRSQVNGTWQLYVMDDCAGDTNNISGGWTLTVNTEPSNAIAIPPTGSTGKAAVYPIEVPVSGRTGSISKVRVLLDGLAHTYPDDLDILLEGPTGATTMLMSDAGGLGLETLDSAVGFDDAGYQGVIPDNGPVHSGYWRPSNYNGSDPDTFPAPAPAGPYGSALSAFNGTNPNGTWRVFIVDDAPGDVGGVRGASLEITTSAAGQSTTVTSSSKDVKAPVAGFVGSGRPKLSDVLKNGEIPLKIRTNEASTFSGQGILGAVLAGKLGLPANGKAFTSRHKKPKPAIVAKGKRRVAKAGTYSLKLKLTKKARRMLARRGKTVKLGVRTRVTDKAGNRRLLKRTLTLKG